MIATINYGSDRLSLNLPDKAIFHEYRNVSTGDPIDFDTFRSALEIGEQGLFPISEAELFVLNDAYRPTPSAEILGWLDELGKLNDRAGFLIATGCHGAPSEPQLKQIFGRFYSRFSGRILIHDTRNSESMAEVGRDIGGEPVLLNRTFLDADKVAVVGSVEPHYFAGFTGGRKSIFPGLCDYETTVRNHNRGINFLAVPLKLDGNPIEEHFRQLMQHVEHKNILAIQIVMGQERTMQYVFCGTLAESFHRAAGLSRRMFGHRVNSPYDLILAEVRPPLDSNLYQLQKSLENCQSAVADKGTVILFSPCREGIGAENFYRLADRWSPDSGVILGHNDNFGIHKLYRVNRIGRRINVKLYSELAYGIPDKVFFPGERNPQTTIDNLAKNRQYIAVALVRDAGHTVLEYQN